MGLLNFLLIMARSFFDAFVLWKLWTWFIVPLGVVHISYWHAYGLDVFFGLIAAGAVVYYGKDQTENDRFELIVGKAVGFAFALGAGYVAHKLAGLA